MKPLNFLLWVVAFICLTWVFYQGMVLTFTPAEYQIDSALAEQIKRSCKPQVIREVARPCPTTTLEYLSEPEFIYVPDNSCLMKLTACNQGLEKLKNEKTQCQLELADEQQAFLSLFNKCK